MQITSEFHTVSVGYKGAVKLCPPGQQVCLRNAGVKLCTQPPVRHAAARDDSCRIPVHYPRDAERPREIALHISLPPPARSVLQGYAVKSCYKHPAFVSLTPVQTFVTNDFSSHCPIISTCKLFARSVLVDRRCLSQRTAGHCVGDCTAARSGGAAHLITLTNRLLWAGPRACN